MTESDTAPQAAQDAATGTTTPEPGEYLATAVVHFRVHGTNMAEAMEIAKDMFADALEASELFGDGAVATVLPD